MGNYSGRREEVDTYEKMWSMIKKREKRKGFSCLKTCYIDVSISLLQSLRTPIVEAKPISFSFLRDWWMLLEGHMEGFSVQRHR